MYRHLVAVEVRVECGTDKWMDLDGLTLDQHRLKCLDTETVQRGCAIQQHRVLANHFLKNVPDDWFLPLDHLTRLFDGRSVSLFLELVVDKWFEQLEGHLLRQSALMKFQLRTNHDHRAARIVNALTE